jgi:hypothetical protein
MVEHFEAVVFGLLDKRWRVVERRPVADVSEGLKWAQLRLSTPALCGVYARLCARVISSGDDETVDSVLRQLGRRSGSGRSAGTDPNHYKHRRASA